MLGKLKIAVMLMIAAVLAWKAGSWNGARVERSVQIAECNNRIEKLAAELEAEKAKKKVEVTKSASKTKQSVLVATDSDIDKRLSKWARDNGSGSR